ncbi:Hypothetical protein HVR_LOCUS1257 [uncultured virus]|nr:Hypothetical protein HVR_LOCUS1257 [uncultured virus]
MILVLINITITIVGAHQIFKIYSMESILELMGDDSLTENLPSSAQARSCPGETIPLLSDEWKLDWKDWRGHNDNFNHMFTSGTEHTSLNPSHEIKIHNRIFNPNIISTSNRFSRLDNFNNAIDPLEMAHDEACQLLSDCLHSDKRSFEKAELAVGIIRKFKLTGFDLYQRGLVHYPNLLRDFLQIQRKKGSIISDNDLASMFARCIEAENSCSKQSTTCSNQWNEQSMDIILEYHGTRDLEIKLLPRKYIINYDLYEKAKSHGVVDKYYDAVMNGETIPYTHLDIVAKENTKVYTGFRDAYHILLYGGNAHLQSLIVRWDLWGDDCTTDAARDFFGLDSSTVIEFVKERVNQKCRN